MEDEICYEIIAREKNVLAGNLLSRWEDIAIWGEQSVFDGKNLLKETQTYLKNL